MGSCLGAVSYTHLDVYKRQIDAFKQVKDSKKPIVVHINTLKGKGYAPAAVSYTHLSGI